MCRVWNTSNVSQEGEDLFLSTLTVSGCAEFGIFTNLPFACAGSGILNYYSNGSQEGEDLFLSTFTVSLVFRVWNTELLLQVSQEGEDLFLSTLTVCGCAVFGIFTNLYLLHVQSLEY
jgi:hypothetical protein